MDEIKQFRSSTAVITPEAEEAARAKLFAEMRAVPVRRRTPRLAWRLALAAALAILVGGGVVATRGPVEMTQVASVRELGERAAQATTETPTPEANPGQWLYVKQLQAPQAEDGSGGVDLGKRVPWEVWTSVDGKQTAWMENGNLGIQGTHPGISTADLSKAPVTPESMRERIVKVLEGMNRYNADGSEYDEPMDSQLFQAVYQMMAEKLLNPEVRAALFRLVASIPGVTVTQEVADADGRVGVAFSYTYGWTRYDLILDRDDYRFLGTYGVAVKDNKATYSDGTTLTTKAGTPLVLSAQLEATIVNKPGERP